jgi:hypothetical protein
MSISERSGSWLEAKAATETGVDVDQTVRPQGALELASVIEDRCQTLRDEVRRDVPSVDVIDREISVSNGTLTIRTTISTALTA